MKEAWSGVIAGVGWGEESDSDITWKKTSKNMLNMYKIR